MLPYWLEVLNTVGQAAMPPSVTPSTPIAFGYLVEPPRGPYGNTPASKKEVPLQALEGGEEERVAKE